MQLDTEGSGGPWPISKTTSTKFRDEKSLRALFSSHLLLKSLFSNRFCMSKTKIPPACVPKSKNCDCMISIEDTTSFNCEISIYSKFQSMPAF